MSYKSVKEEGPIRSVQQECLRKVSSKKCLTGVSSKSVREEVSSKSVLQECQASSVLKECQVRQSSKGESSKSVPEEVSSKKSVQEQCQARVSNKSVKQCSSTRVSPQCVNSGCLTSEFVGNATNKYCLCLSTYVSAFGFVGFILLFIIESLLILMYFNSIKQPARRHLQ